MPETGRIDTYSGVHVATLEFADDTPYISAIASFGPARITGILCGVDPAVCDEVALVGEPVRLAVEPRGTTGDRLVVFRPHDSVERDCTLVSAPPGSTKRPAAQHKV